MKYKEQVMIVLLCVSFIVFVCAITSSKDTPESAPEPVTTEDVQEVSDEATEPTATASDSLGTFKVTAYCACEKCCPGTSDGLTYTETIATEGRTISVDPTIIPLGSVIELNGQQYIAEDIGGSVKGKHVDLYFDSHADALEYGVQYHEIHLISSEAK